MRKIFTLLMVVLIFSLLVLGCGSTRKLGGKSAEEKYKERPGVINENFDPMRLDREEVQIQRTTNIESKSEDIDLLLQEDNSPQESREVVGYRVQICAVSDEQKAREIQREAILNFIDENVYLKYDAPYYKVRIGDFEKKEDADKIKQIAISRGFKDAWVVRTKIKLNPQKKIPPQQPNQQPPNE